MKFDKKNFSLDLAQDISTAGLHKKMFKCLLFILFPPVPCNPKEFNTDLDVIFQNFLQLFLHRPYKKMQYKYIMYFIKRLSSWLFNYNQLNLPEQKNSYLWIQFESSSNLNPNSNSIRIRHYYIQVCLRCRVEESQILNQTTL